MYIPSSSFYFQLGIKLPDLTVSHSSEQNDDDAPPPRPQVTPSLELEYGTAFPWWCDSKTVGYVTNGPLVSGFQPILMIISILITTLPGDIIPFFTAFLLSEILHCLWLECFHISHWISLVKIDDAFMKHSSMPIARPWVDSINTRLWSN